MAVKADKKFKYSFVGRNNVTRTGTCVILDRTSVIVKFRDVDTDIEFNKRQEEVTFREI